MLYRNKKNIYYRVLLRFFLRRTSMHLSQRGVVLGNAKAIKGYQVNKKKECSIVDNALTLRWPSTVRINWTYESNAKTLTILIILNRKHFKYTIN